MRAKGISSNLGRHPYGLPTNPRSSSDKPEVREPLLPDSCSSVSGSLRIPALKKQGLTPSFTVETGRLKQGVREAACMGLSPLRPWSP